MKKPRLAKVGGHIYRIRYGSTPRTLDGYTEPANKLIVIHSTLRGSRAAAQLHHELSHAIWSEWEISNSERERVTEETAVSLMSAGWWTVLAANRGLLSYFNNHLRTARAHTAT